MPSSGDFPPMRRYRSRNSSTIAFGVGRPCRTLRRNGSTASRESGPPSAISRTPIRDSTVCSPPRCLVDQLDESSQVILRRRREDAMAQIEHVAGSAIRPFEYIPCGGLPIVSRAQESGRIEVPLDPHVLADRNPSAVQRDAPVDADHVAAGPAERVQEPRRPGPEVDRDRKSTRLNSSHVSI